MEMLSQRRWYTPTSTISELFLGITHPVVVEVGSTFSTGPAVRECFILEDRVRAAGVKVQNETAIPAGRYRVIVDWSNRFKKYAFHILNVPNFTGIRIHSGNTDKDTDGCLLVGQERALNAVFQSRTAFGALWEKLTEEAGWDEEHDCQAFKMKEETWITIEDDPQALAACRNRVTP
jgi:uncharacterized protein DUF5675